jgi:hypothetical protein
VVNALGRIRYGKQLKNVTVIKELLLQFTLYVGNSSMVKILSYITKPVFKTWERRPEHIESSKG